MCGFALSRDKYRTQPDEFRDILRQGMEAGVGYVRFTGGEPLMHRDILDLVGIAKETDTRSSLITNGFSLPLMAKSLAEAGLDQVIVSIDSGEAALHDEYRNTPKLFEKAFLGILASRKYGIQVRVNTVIGPHNYESMPLLRELITEAGVTQWELSALKLSSQITYDTPGEALAVGRLVYEGPGVVPMGKKWFGDTDEEQRRYFEDGTPPRASGPVCHVADDVMYLDPKAGYLFPCSLLPHRSTPSLYGGDVSRGEGVVHLAAPKFEDRRRFFRENGPKLCTGCSSSAAGYSDDRAAGLIAEPWAY